MINSQKKIPEKKIVGSGKDGLKGKRKKICLRYYTSIKPKRQTQTPNIKPNALSDFFKQKQWKNGNKNKNKSAGDVKFGGIDRCQSN